ncbi:MAG: GntR family transcriptional regulator [Thermomicrobiales bacterium]
MRKPTESDRVFNGIVSDIFAGLIRPRERLSERELVARYGVSRTPIREATKRLHERGFVERGPKGVAVVVDIGPDDLQNLYELRLQLERDAAAQIAKNITAEEISRLKQINRDFKEALAERDLMRMLEVRADFHATLTGATRNRWLAMILTLLRDKAYVVRHYHWQDIERAAQTVDIHVQMIRALEKRDVDAFVKLVDRQIRGAITTYKNRLQVLTPRHMQAKGEAPASSKSSTPQAPRRRAAA